MGLPLFKPSNGNTTAPNPNPTWFTIVDMWEFGAGSGAVTVAEIHYHGCTTHQGRKICVYRASATQVKHTTKLDPHFLDEGFCPIARFPATPQGRIDAFAYATWKAQR